MRVHISRRARIDLGEIGDWIAGDSRRSAARMVNALLDSAEALGHHPERYQYLPEMDVRKVTHGAYFIFYRVTHQVEVLRILHSARDWPVIINDDGDAP